MALRVKYVGKYGPHGTAHRLGVREGDIVIAFDSRTDLMSEQELHAYVVTSKKAGDSVKLRVLRGERNLGFELPIQE